MKALIKRWRTVFRNHHSSSLLSFFSSLQDANLNDLCFQIVSSTRIIYQKESKHWYNFVIAGVNIFRTASKLSSRLSFWFHDFQWQPFWENGSANSANDSPIKYMGFNIGNKNYFALCIDAFNVIDGLPTKRSRFRWRVGEPWSISQTQGHRVQLPDNSDTPWTLSFQGRERMQTTR